MTVMRSGRGRFPRKWSWFPAKSSLVNSYKIMRLKKIIYLFLSIVLGLILSFLIHALIEIIYLQNVNSATVNWHSVLGKGSCALPIWLQIGLPILGIVGGYLLGCWWWRIVYIEHRHGKFKNNNLN